ncbi:hypothetical protein [Kingella potus]|uniref:hypothetical protein n=1 Tax=Kingella potus TaxID=265175 RepID=UPI001FD432AC|nr:hypothetical protein [Kingella potus]UOP00204.1 hypothetical protein LVJ84_09735 [Kingella potus]
MYRPKATHASPYLQQRPSEKTKSRFQTVSSSTSKTPAPTRRVCRQSDARVPQTPQQTHPHPCARAVESWGRGGSLQNRLARCPANVCLAATAPTLTLPRRRKREQTAQAV